MKIVKFKVKFDGIYAWSQGWRDRSAADRWYGFWTGIDSVFWKPVQKDGSVYVVACGGGGMTHPMGFSIAMQVFGGCSQLNDDGTTTEVFPALDDLTELCKAAAEACGGTASFEPLVTAEI